MKVDSLYIHIHTHVQWTLFQFINFSFGPLSVFKEKLLYMYMYDCTCTPRDQSKCPLFRGVLYSEVRNVLAL